MNSTSLGVGGADCPFTAIMTVELQNGETKTIAMATDDCSVWMSQGLYYKYGGVEGFDNTSFYSLFAPSVIHEAAKSGVENLMNVILYLNWSSYAKAYGWQETMNLMDILRDWVKEEPDLSRIQGFMHMNRGLEGDYRQRYGAA